MKDNESIFLMKPGGRAKIKSFRNLPDSFLLRCQEIGLLPDTEIEFVRRAPLGSPVEICFHDTHILLQKETAENIEIVNI